MFKIKKINYEVTKTLCALQLTSKFSVDRQQEEEPVHARVSGSVQIFSHYNKYRFLEWLIDLFDSFSVQCC